MADDSKTQLVILRFSGELSTKARATRYQFTRRLLHNLRNALESQGIEPQMSFEEGTGPVEEEGRRPSPISPIALIWVLLLVGGTLYRACAGG